MGKESFLFLIRAALTIPTNDLSGNGTTGLVIDNIIPLDSYCL